MFAISRHRGCGGAALTVVEIFNLFRLGICFPHQFAVASRITNRLQLAVLKHRQKNPIPPHARRRCARGHRNLPKLIRARSEGHRRLGRLGNAGAIRPAKLRPGIGGTGSDNGTTYSSEDGVKLLCHSGVSLVKTALHASSKSVTIKSRHQTHGSEQNILNEFSEMLWLFAMPSHHHDKFTLETVWQSQPNERSLLSVKCQRPHRYKAHAHAERHKSDDEIKTIELHGRINFQAAPAHPPTKFSSCVCFFLKQQPRLSDEPRKPCDAGLRQRLKPSSQLRRSNQ